MLVAGMFLKRVIKAILASESRAYAASKSTLTRAGGWNTVASLEKSNRVFYARELYFFMPVNFYG